MLQLPLVQTLLYATSLLLQDLERLQLYLQPAALLSILVAVWAVGVVLRLVGGVPRVRAKFAALQAVLVLSKLQALVARAVVALQLASPLAANREYLSSLPRPLRGGVAHRRRLLAVVYDGALLAEMAALCAWARTLYRSHEASPPVDVAVSVCVVDSFFGKAK